MRYLVLTMFACIVGFQGQAQGVADLKQTLAGGKNAVQAIHHYPPDIKDGECHLVPVTSVTVQGNLITITETWTNYMGRKSQTVLTGVLQGQAAKGTWKSSFSEGAWSYDFGSGVGQWTKTGAPLRFGTFREYQPLEFRVVPRPRLHDGFKACN